MFDPKVFMSSKGRIGRQQWWISALIVSVIAIAFIILNISSSFLLVGTDNGIVGWIMLIIQMVAYFAIMGAFITINVKRLHDIDKPGWYILIAAYVPLIGWFILMAMLGFKKGTVGPNQYGDDPLQPNINSLLAN
jgi:uncharacterized membrane protein YhaH (DUF805 family)